MEGVYFCGKVYRGAYVLSARVCVKCFVCILFDFIQTGSEASVGDLLN